MHFKKLPINKAVYFKLLVQNLPDKSFSSIINLYSLDLHGCSILNISVKAFQGLETLRVLQLSMNTLDKV